MLTSSQKLSASGVCNVKKVFKPSLQLNRENQQLLKNNHAFITGLPFILLDVACSVWLYVHMYMDFRVPSGVETKLPPKLQYNILCPVSVPQEPLWCVKIYYVINHPAIYLISKKLYLHTFHNVHEKIHWKCLHTNWQSRLDGWKWKSVPKREWVFAEQ